MCGEQFICIKLKKRLKGSPPRVRGTAMARLHGEYVKRITPACAGNRNFSSSHIFLLTDHPRVCGEQYASRRQKKPVWGSPPRVRGTANPNCKRARTDGITPACAGNSFCHLRWAYICWDHPRVCGEQLAQLGKMQVILGSPPRVRGTGQILLRHYPKVGITPACAGNSPIPADQLVHAQDHPRVCGEQSKTYAANERYAGSPPRVRGTVRQAHLPHP